MGLFSNRNVKNKDAFAERERQQKIWQFTRRIIDVHSPSSTAEQLSNRDWERYNRCLPVACVPVVTDDLDTSLIFYGCTKDFSENGISLITSEVLDASLLICGFWLDDAKLVRGRVRRVHPFGGDLYEIGIEFTDVIESSDMMHLLKAHLRKLDPSSTVITDENLVTTESVSNQQ